MLYGELPNAEQAAAWEKEITYHTFIHENVRKRFLEGFNYDAHPMGMLVSAIAALSTYYKDAKDPRRPRDPAQADRAPDRQDADARRRGAPLLASACPSSTPTTPWATPRTSSR